MTPLFLHSVQTSVFFISVCTRRPNGIYKKHEINVYQLPKNHTSCKHAKSKIGFRDASRKSAEAKPQKSYAYAFADTGNASKTPAGLWQKMSRWP